MSSLPLSSWLSLPNPSGHRSERQQPRFWKRVLHTNHTRRGDTRWRWSLWYCMIIMMILPTIPSEVEHTEKITGVTSIIIKHSCLELFSHLIIAKWLSWKTTHCNRLLQNLTTMKRLITRWCGQELRRPRNCVISQHLKSSSWSALQGPKACLKLISRPGWSDKGGDQAKVVKRKEMA